MLKRARKEVEKIGPEKTASIRARQSARLAKHQDEMPAIRAQNDVRLAKYRAKKAKKEAKKEEKKDKKDEKKAKKYGSESNSKVLFISLIICKKYTIS